MSEQWPEVPYFIEPASPATNDIEYRLLTGHARWDGSYKTSEQLRSEYVELTDRLVHKMTQGLEVVDPETNERVTRVPDVVVWLDKSARPVSWLTKELWDTLAADKDGHVPKMPEFKFVNIDREQWVNTIDPQGLGAVDVEQVDRSIVRSLRSIYISPAHKREGLTEEIDETPTYLDGKTVMIVDEVHASGRTLDYAKKFFRTAFPRTAIGGVYWMGGVASNGIAVGNADLPVWYKANDPSGRGIGNRNEGLSARSKSRTQRLGAWFLSTQVSKDDTNSSQLRSEIHQLGEDVRGGKILVIPSLDREEDDYVERAQRLNHTDLSSFIARKASLKASK